MTTDGQEDTDEWEPCEACEWCRAEGRNSRPPGARSSERKGQDRLACVSARLRNSTARIAELERRLADARQETQETIEEAQRARRSAIADELGETEILEPW